MKGKDFALIIAGIFIAILLMKDFGCVSYMKDTEPKETVKPIIGEVVHDSIAVTEVITVNNPVYDGYKQKYIDLISRITKIPPRETEKKQDPYAEPDQFPDTGKKVADCPPVNMPPILRQKDTLHLPENLGFVVSSHVVAGAILETKYLFNINKFEKTLPPRRTLYLGGGAFFIGNKTPSGIVGELGVKANIAYQNKKGQIFIVSPGIASGQYYAEISTVFPIRLRKRK